MSTTSSDLRKRLATTRTSGIRVRARELASGWATGSHRADRKGAGVEFAGHRAYTQGDDLRYLDRHALLRHKQLLIREVLTDTERAIHLVVDATESMNYRGQAATSARAKDGTPAESKAERALLLAAALAFIAKDAGDHLGLTWITGEREQTIKPRLGGEAFEHVLYHLEALDKQAETHEETQRAQATAPVDFRRIYSTLGALLPRGTVIFVLSDFLDADEATCRALASLCTQKRTVRLAQVLTPDEVTFPFEGSLRLRDPETFKEVETDAGSVRTAYQEALARLSDRLRTSVESQGGRFVRVETKSSPGDALLALTHGTPNIQRPSRAQAESKE